MCVVGMASLGAEAEGEACICACAAELLEEADTGTRIGGETKEAEGSAAGEPEAEAEAAEETERVEADGNASWAGLPVWNCANGGCGAHVGEGRECCW